MPIKFYLQLSEYIILRLIRKFIFSYNFLLKFGKYFPYFKVNLNQSNSNLIVEEYFKCIMENCPQILEKHNLKVLEIGVGKTNSTGYMISKIFKCEVDVYDPYVEFDSIEDGRMLNYFNISKSTIDNVNRVVELNTNEYDLILSHSVLEHVEDLDTLFKSNSLVLKENGISIHIVDYRDHFFKYPYFFLMFTDNTWNKWLNPGDLYRWRLDDHIESARKANFDIKVLDIVKQEPDKISILKKINERFLKLKNWNVLTAKIILTKVN